MNETIVQQLLDRAEIADVVTRVATCADARDWAGVRACFTDEVDLDYTSLSGGTSVRLRADDLVAQWQQTLSGFEATHHLLANQLITVNGDEATCFAYVQATHLLPTSTGESTWTLGGTYTYLLSRTQQGWKIRSSTFIVKWAKGNQQLVTLAQARVQQTSK